MIALKESQSSVKELQAFHVALKSSQSPAFPFERAWEKLFVAAAVIDIFNTYLPPMLKEREARDKALVLEEIERKKILPKFLTFWKKDSGIILDLTAEQCVDGFKCMYERSVHWMEDHRMLLNWIFCVCWILDSVRKAYFAWKSAPELEKTASQKATNGTKMEKYTFSIMTPGRWAFVKTLLFRLSLLPIGFYTLSLVDHISILTLNESSSIDHSHIDPSKDTAPDYNRYSVLFAIILKSKFMLLLCLQTQIASLKTVFKKKIAPRIIRFAILKPRMFKKRIASLLVVLRWLKYLIPIFQKAEKLFKTLFKIIRIRIERRERAKQKRLKKEKWDNHTAEQRLYAAACRLQACYRAKIARREIILKNIFDTGKKRRGMMRIKDKLLLRAKNTKAEIRRKKNEFINLSVKSSTKVGDNLRLKKLQLELGSDCKKKELHKMMLRPNTKFIVGWKIMFMICIGIEMLQKAFPSEHVGNMDEATSLQLSLEAMFVPNRIEDWASCTDDTVGGNRFLGIFHASEISATNNSSELSWYCDAPYTTIQSGYIRFVQFLIYNGLSCMSNIFFLDVFVNFFTGKYDESGFLVPNSFVPRWIFPGIGFQLLVNPKMKDLCAIVKTFLNHPGPARLYQWLIAFVIPILAIVVYWLKWNVWMVFVSSENKKTSSRK